MEHNCHGGSILHGTGLDEAMCAGQDQEIDPPNKQKRAIHAHSARALQPVQSEQHWQGHGKLHEDNDNLLTSSNQPMPSRPDP